MATPPDDQPPPSGPNPSLSPPPPPPSPPPPSQTTNLAVGAKPLGEITPWLDDVVQHALTAKKTAEDALESAISYTRDRIDQILWTSSAHFQMTLDSLQDVKSKYTVYEDIAFGKMKEAIVLAASNPLTTSSVVLGSSILVLRRPRRFLYYNTLRLFVNEENLLARANAKVDNLRKSIDVLKAESIKLEKESLKAEEDMRRGRKKLSQAGNQIQGVIRSAYKIERQAGGLKDILGELPKSDASKFRSQVSSLTSEAKRERISLGKSITKISNYGISV